MPFTIGEKLILTATVDIFHELLGEDAVQKVAYVPLSASTIARWMGEIAEDIEEQLLERHHCTMLQVDESTDIENKATTLVFVQYIFFFRRMCMRICYVHFCGQPTPQVQTNQFVLLHAWTE